MNEKPDRKCPTKIQSIQDSVPSNPTQIKHLLSGIQLAHNCIKASQIRDIHQKQAERVLRKLMEEFKDE